MDGRAGGGENMREKADTGLRRCKGSKGPHCDKDSSFPANGTSLNGSSVARAPRGVGGGGRGSKKSTATLYTQLFSVHASLTLNSHILSSSEKKSFDFSLELDILSDLIGIKFSFEPLLIKGTAIRIGLL